MHARPNRRGFGLIALAIGTSALLALSACSSGSPTGPAEAIDVSTDLTSEEITLTLAYTDDPPTTALIEGFEKLHPNITIDAQQTPFSDYVKSIKLVMASDTPPDLAQYNPGAMRSLIPGGLVLDLTPWSDAYGWDTTFPQASLSVLSSDDEAKTYGTGGLYAVPGALSVLGLYYNTDKLAAAGVEMPLTTLDAFSNALGAVAATGEQPISVAALEAGGLHLWNAVLNGFGDTAAYRDWVYGVPGSTIETPAAKEATDLLVEWIDAGYITESANAVSFGDGMAEFADGASAFNVNGNWAAASFEDSLGDSVGFSLMPAATTDSPAVASGASVAYSISSKSEYPNEAAAFLDYLASADAATIQFDTGFMPVSTTATVEADGLRAEIAEGFSEVVAADGIVPFPDFAAPAMIDSLVTGLQALISKQSTSDEFLSTLQQTWNEYHG
jgi:raffinose/stachyose/melibiose transport system substrate-binding protein